MSCGEIASRDGFDTVVVAQYNRADDALREPLSQAGFTIRLAGDCLSPRTAMEAVYEGHELAMIA